APADARAATAPCRATEGGARKVVTIVFADLAGSTSLHERLDAESVRALMDRFYDALRAVVAAHDGTVVKLLGDGVMAAFGVPRARAEGRRRDGRRVPRRVARAARAGGGDLLRRPRGRAAAPTHRP